MSPIEDLRDAVEKCGIPILAQTDVKEDEGDGLARGGYAIVRLGTLKADKSRVAIKRMLDYLNDEDHRRLFCKEIKILAKTTVEKHPNIVRLLGVCLKPVSAICEHIEFNLDDIKFRKVKASKKGNNTLAHLLRILDELKLVEEVGVKQGVLRQAAVDVAAGLAFLHEHDIYHRDLKPSNVLATNSGQSFTFKLTDFGESRGRDLQTASIFHTTTYRVCRGTTLFYAPEQFLETLMEADKVDLRRIDIWGYGLIIFCILAPDLKSPWERERTDSAIRKAMRDQILPKGSYKYRNLREQTGLHQIYTICCQYDPACRPAMNDVINELTSITCSPRNTGSSASPTAAAEKHVPAGDEADIVSEPSKAKRRQLVTSGASVYEPSSMSIVSEPTKEKRRRVTSGASADVPSTVSKPTEEKRVQTVTTPEVQGLAASLLSASAPSCAGTTRKESFFLVKRTKNVKKCRGCTSKFPETIRSPDDLVVCRWERYEYFARKVRMKRTKEGNRYYHVSASCLRSHGEQSVENLVITTDIELSDEHFTLYAKSGLTLDRFVNKNVQ